MSKIKRDAEILNSTISKYLERNSLKNPNPGWEIRKSQLGGYGIFATRPIQVGEVIFKDCPVIFGPRAASTGPPLCANCYKEGNLQQCEKGCYLQFCSLICQNSKLHQKECKIISQWITKPIKAEALSTVLTPIRSLLLSEEDKEVVVYLKSYKSDQHGLEVDVMKNQFGFNIKDDEEEFMRFVCSILDSNAFEVLVGNGKDHSSVRGLYPLGSLANHCCTPNTIHVFDENRIMITRACKFINKDAEIFHSYTRLIWGTPLRRLHLAKSKHFWCKCERCRDPAEFGAYLGSILCKVCKGLVVAMVPLDNASKWRCETCKQVLNRRDVVMVTSLLSSSMNSFSDDSFEYLLKFLEVKLPGLVPENNEIVVELKYQLIWILGYRQGYTWPELPEHLLSKKELYCLDLLSLLKLLHLGQCKMRGLLLYELYCCRKENRRRREKSIIISKTESPAWEIRNSELGGFGVFATRPIAVGEVIFKDSPIILGPRAALTSPITCVICYKKSDLKKCNKGCGLPICSATCQNSSLHKKECKVIKQWITQPLDEETSFTKLTKVLTPIRFLFLNDEDKKVVTCLQSHKSNNCGYEVELMKNELNFNLNEDDEALMRYVCAVLDANGFEVIIGNEESQSSVRGLYPLSSLINHCCIPNTVHVFDENHYMTVRATNFIDKDTEIFHSYVRSIWGTSLRTLHLLRTKNFWCKCDRCKDPTEFGSYIGAILCKICKGCVIPKDPLSSVTDWQCKGCGLIVDRKDVAIVTSLLGSVLNSFSGANLEVMLKFMEQKLPDLVPETNQTLVELKYRAIWILGYFHNFSWSELSETLLLKKEKYCTDLLSLLKMLRLGQCKIKGLLLYELYCCRKEKNKRKENNGIMSKNDNSLERLLDEAADILMYDVSAPTEVKQKWSSETKGYTS